MIFIKVVLNASSFHILNLFCSHIVFFTPFPIRLFIPGEGKAREEANRTTVFKRAIDRNYQLKLQASRQVFSEIQKRFPDLPFTLRCAVTIYYIALILLSALAEKKRRLGIVELVKHDLLDSYPVLYERDGEFVAQFKFTALILPSSTMRMNAFPLPHVSSQYSVDSYVVVLLRVSRG